MAVKDNTTQNPEHALKNLKLVKKKVYLIATFMSLTISSKKIKTSQRSSTLGARR